MSKEALKPLISVIVPVHNGQDFLENCVDTICAQTYPNVEVILVDDGSVDNTNAICTRLCREKENISLITMEDLGVSAARNRAIRQAKGEYITFVDADDRIHPQMLSVLADCLEETESDLAGCGFFAWQDEASWKEGSGKIQMQDVQALGRNAVIHSAEEFVLNGILKNNTRCWSKLYRRNCFDNTLFREGLTIGEDMMFLVDMVPYLKKAASVEFAGYGYFRNPAGAMNRKFKPSYMDQILCWELAEKQLCIWAQNNKNMSEEQKEQITQICSARKMVSIMLAAGKLAELTGAEKKSSSQYSKICHEKILEAVRNKTGMKLLDRGYQIKVRMFSMLPGAYLMLYGALQRKKKR